MRRLVTVGVFAALTGALWPGPAEPVRAQGPACLVATSDGLVQGLDRGASCEFLGIPFAAPAHQRAALASATAAGTVVWRAGADRATAGLFVDQRDDRSCLRASRIACA